MILSSNDMIFTAYVYENYRHMYMIRIPDFHVSMLSRCAVTNLIACAAAIPLPQVKTNICIKSGCCNVYPNGIRKCINQMCAAHCRDDSGCSVNSSHIPREPPTPSQPVEDEVDLAGHSQES